MSIMSAVAYQTVYLPANVGDYAERQLIGQGVQLAIRDLLKAKSVPLLPAEDSTLTASVTVTVDVANADGSRILIVEAI